MQFKQRYAGYQVPVLSLNEKELEIVNSSTDIRIEVKGATRKRSSIKAKVPVEDADMEDEVSEDADADSVVAPDSEVTIVSPKSSLLEEGEPNADGTKTAKKPASQAFVSLVDILPPLPAKGNFSVETIKKSLYFFS